MRREIMEILLVPQLGFVILMFFFWIRGIKKSSKSDVLLAIFLLLFSCISLMATADSCEVFDSIGLVLIIFGIISLMLGRKTEETNLVIKGSSIRAIGVGSIILGILLQLHA